MVNSTLDGFCGSTFWDMELTWNTADPDLTICFEKTVLVWFPCAFLLAFTAFDVYYIVTSKLKDIPWTVINVSKLGVNCSLIVLSVCDLGFAIYYNGTKKYIMHNVDLYTPLIETLTFTLAAVLLIYNKKHGMRASGLLFLFWGLCMLCAIPQLQTEIRLMQGVTPEPYYFFISFYIYFGLLVIIFLLNCFVDAEPRFSEYPKSKKPWPEKRSGFLSRLFFSWFDPLAWKGFRKPLVTNDLWDLKMEDSSKIVVPLFNKHWQNTLKKFESSHPQTRTSNQNDSADVDFIDSSKKKKKYASVLPALVKSFGATCLFCALTKLSFDIMTFISPKILGWLINFVENNEPQWKGYFYAILLFVAAVIETLILSQYVTRMLMVGMHIRTALVCAIYRKALRMSNAARKEFTVGEIINLISVDTENIVEFSSYINIIWSSPVQIILAVYFLWEVLGPSVLAGLAVMVLLIPINGFVINKAEMLEDKLLKNKDERVKLMNEILSGIKVLKLYAWEPSFEEHVLRIREKEMKVLKQEAYLNAGTSLLWSCAPFLVTFVSFATFVLVDEKNVLDAKTAFVSLSLLSILHYPFKALPMVISNIVQARVSMRRINKFMNCEEVDPKSVSHDQENAPLIIDNGNFHWGKGLVLKNINLRFPANSLTAIVGSVGSGKSSLVSAFLGEMEKTSGRVNTLGSIAYVAQQAWIQNATLQQNILFGKKMNIKRYEKIIEACALKPDFDMLPAGDRTEIGEKGINLSGGQKQRISLARAVYANSDIYFLDDPLSAVDSHVGKHIFEKVIGPHGLLKDKTRVLVTHGITYLPQTDKIVVLTNGEVSESGTYQDLINNKGAFAEFLIQHMNEAAEEVDDDGLGKLKKQLSDTLSESPSETGSLQRQKSRRRFSLTTEHRSKLKIGEKLIEVEKEETGSVKWGVYKHYLKYIGWGLTAVALLFNMIVQGFSVGSNLWLSVWSTDIEMKNKDTAKRDLYLGVYAALGLGQCIATFFMDIALFIGCWYAAKHLHEKLLKNVMRSPLRFFDVTPIGRILSRFSGDVDAVDETLVILFSEGLNCFFEVAATLFVISFTTPIFAVVIIPVAILYYFIQRFYVPTSRQLKRLESISWSPIYSHFGESVTGAVAIRAFKEQERFINESEAKVDFNQVCYYLGLIANRWLSVRLEMIGNLIILSAALFAVVEKDRNAGLVGLSVSYSLQITHTLNWLVRMTSSIETNIVAVERIKEYLEIPQEAPWEIPNMTPPDSWPENGTVEFKNYAMRYREGLDFALKRVNFSINGGEKVGIVGRTGAGKSSLTLALFRIIEAAEGEIQIDGYNISEVGLHALRSQLTIIPQDAVLFSGSLRMNLDPFDKHSDNEVWTALEQAHLKSFVKSLPAGLNYEVAEGGENLSVGQRQLICLSRALLRKTKVLILDEATAAIDLETDDLIQRTIRTEFKDCTVLTIAHRLNTIMDSDRVMVLDKGQIVDFDSPQNLLQDTNSIFYSMCKDAGIEYNNT